MPLETGDVCDHGVRFAHTHTQEMCRRVRFSDGFSHAVITFVHRLVQSDRIQLEAYDFT